MLSLGQVFKHSHPSARGGDLFPGLWDCGNAAVPPRWQLLQVVLQHSSSDTATSPCPGADPGLYYTGSNTAMSQDLECRWLSCNAMMVAQSCISSVSFNNERAAFLQTFH